MRRRRRDSRYVLASPWEGTLSVPGDILIEHHDDDHKEVWVMSALPARRDELLTLDLVEPGRRLTVRVVESSPVLVEGFVRHRLRLAIVG